MAKLPSRQELLEKVRRKAEEMKSGRRDPDQFIPPKVRENEIQEFTFRVLPELSAGETCRGGVAKEDAPIWYHENGTHYINDERYPCPRIHDHNECPLCKMGFELLAESDNKEYRKKIIRQYLATSYYAVNIYFPNVKKNPENLRGKVMWFNMPKTLHTKMEECINNDDVGDDEEPKASGIFYHPNEGYNFKLVVKHKGGFNDYSESAFVAKSLSPLVKTESGEPDEVAIQAILDQRIYLPERFKPRDASKLQAVIDRMASKAAGDETVEIETEEEMPAGITKGAAANAVPKAKPSAAPPKAAPAPAPASSDDDDGAPEMPVNEEVEQPAAPVVPVKKATPAPATPAVPTPDTSDDDPELADLLTSIKKKKAQ